MAALDNSRSWMIRHTFSMILFGIFLQTKFVNTEKLRLNLSRSELDEYIKIETEVADKLLVDYDKRFIPTIPSIPETPLKVKLQIVIADVLRVKDMEAEMIIYIRQTWYDNRFSWNATNGTIKRLRIREHFLDKIWLPDTRIINLKDSKRFDGFGGINTNIDYNGRVYFSQLVQIVTSCPMDLQRFPMDKQTCFLNFSSFAYGKDLLNFVMSENKVPVRQCELPQFELVEAKDFLENITGKMSKLTVAITFQRRAGYYILQVYIPATFLVLLSWLSFFMEASNIADRLALEITMILSTVFLLGGISDSVIRVSYAKASDWFVIISFCFIFLALLETMLVYRLSLSEEAKRKKAKSVPSVLENQLMMKTDEEIELQNIEAKMKQQTVLMTTSSEELTYRSAGSDINTTQDRSKETAWWRRWRCCRKPCIASRWVDKISLVLFPVMFITFNVYYWWHYWP